MNRYAAALSRHPLATHAVGEVAGEILDALDGRSPDLLVWFVTPHHVGALEDIRGALGSLLGPSVMIATAASTVIGGGTEVEDGPGLSALAAVLTGARIDPIRLPPGAILDATGGSRGLAALSEAHTLLLLADPFTTDPGAVLDDAARHPGLTVIGGLSSAGTRPGANRFVLDGDLLVDGAVGVAIGGGPPVGTVVSQGCRPIGEPFTVTAASGRFLETLGGLPALERLQETAAGAGEEDRVLLRSGVHLGVAVDEQRDVLGRGDFLIRSVLGADRTSGAIAVGGGVEVGTTVRFQVRDASSADEDLRELLAGRSAQAALLFTCNGRGSALFGTPDHDARAVQEALGPIPLGGMACAGEFGPVGPRSHLHGFTASVGLLGA